MRVRNENAGPGLACRQPCPGRRKRQDDGVVGGRCRDNEVALPGQADPVTAGEHRLCHGHRRRQTAILRRGPGIFQGHDHIDAGRRRRNRRPRGARIRNQPHGHLGCSGMSCQTGSNRARIRLEAREQGRIRRLALFPGFQAQGPGQQQDDGHNSPFQPPVIAFGDSRCDGIRLGRDGRLGQGVSCTGTLEKQGLSSGCRT